MQLLEIVSINRFGLAGSRRLGTKIYYQSSNVSSKALKLKINKIIKNSSIPIVQFADKKLRDHLLGFLPKRKSRILRLGWKLYARFPSDGHELFCECVCVWVSMCLCVHMCYEIYVKYVKKLTNNINSKSFLIEREKLMLFKLH